MNRQRIPARLAHAAPVGIALFLLASCSSAPEGKYIQQRDEGSLAQAFVGQIELEFKDDNKANYSVAGTTIEVGYEVDGDEVKLLMGGEGTVIGKIEDDGCLQFGAMLGRLCKAED